MESVVRGDALSLNSVVDEANKEYDAFNRARKNSNSNSNSNSNPDNTNSDDKSLNEVPVYKKMGKLTMSVNIEDLIENLRQPEESE